MAVFYVGYLYVVYIPTHVQKVTVNFQKYIDEKATFPTRWMNEIGKNCQNTFFKRKLAIIIIILSWSAFNIRSTE